MMQASSVELGDIRKAENMKLGGFFKRNSKHSEKLIKL